MISRLAIKFPIPGRKRRQMPGVCPEGRGGGLLKLRFDWYIIIFSYTTPVLVFCISVCKLPNKHWTMTVGKLKILKGKRQAFQFLTNIDTQIQCTYTYSISEKSQVKLWLQPFLKYFTYLLYAVRCSYMGVIFTKCKILVFRYI